MDGLSSILGLSVKKKRVVRLPPNAKCGQPFRRRFTDKNGKVSYKHYKVTCPRTKKKVPITKAEYIKRGGTAYRKKAVSRQKLSYIRVTAPVVRRKPYKKRVSRISLSEAAVRSYFPEREIDEEALMF